MSLGPYRTTPALVEGIITVQSGVDLTPFITMANELVTDVCGALGYTDGFVGSRMELLERWLSAHFYCVFDNQLAAAKAGSVAVTYQQKIDFGLKWSAYGQQAMILDTSGSLAAYANTVNTKRNIQLGAFWAGSRCRQGGDVSYGADITIVQ